MGGVETGEGARAHLVVAPRGVEREDTARGDHGADRPGRPVVDAEGARDRAIGGVGAQGEGHARVAEVERRRLVAGRHLAGVLEGEREACAARAGDSGEADLVALVDAEEDPRLLAGARPARPEQACPARARDGSGASIPTPSALSAQCAPPVVVPFVVVTASAPPA